jgi:hypothetical protein
MVQEVAGGGRWSTPQCPFRSRTGQGSIQKSTVQRSLRHITEHGRCKYSGVDYVQKSNIRLGVVLAEGFRNTAEEDGDVLLRMLGIENSAPNVAGTTSSECTSQQAVDRRETWWTPPSHPRNERGRITSTVGFC